MCEKIYNKEYVTPLFENPMPVLSKIANTFYEEATRRLPRSDYGQWLGGTLEEFSEQFHFSIWDLVHVLCIAIALSIVRYILNRTILKQIPIWLDMPPDAAAKFPESCSSTIIYGCSWFWSLYIILKNPKNLFFDLSAHWKFWKPAMEVESGIYWLYIYEMGFYVHFVFTLLVFNVKRKDFVVMLIHHIVTLCLLVWSLAVRFYYVGFVLVFLLDFGDVILEFSKTLVYLSNLGGKKYSFPQQFANFMFLIFTIEWVFCRLYWFPMKVLQSSGHVAIVICPNGPFYIPFNILLYIIYLMQIYWFYFIVRLLVKVAILGEDVDDNREYKEGEMNNKKDS